MPVPDRVQGEPVKIPELLLAKPTLPVGVVGEREEVSVTVAVQVVPEFTVTDMGLQETEVEVESTFTDTARVNVPLLVECDESPA